MRHVKALALAVLFVAGGAAAFAQTAATGNIEGVVTDSSGGVLPGVPVIVRNQDTNVVRDAPTDENGMYRAPALQPGTYEVTATLSGFNARPIPNVRVQVGQTVTVDIRMQPAGVAETVSVTAETPVIDTRRTDVSSVIDETAIDNLPINGRRWDSFVMMSPGVTNDGNFGLISYRGISGLYNNNMVDGVDNNQAFFSEARGRTRAVYSISSASIKEFQVGVSNMSAEFGRAAGGTVNAVTKSGTNTFLGEGFYFLRDKSFMSRDPFVAQEFWDRVDERRQQFGAALGGPIERDRIFFFASYDQQVRDFPPFVNTSSATFYNTCTAPAANCDASRAFFRSLQETPMLREANNKVFLAKVDWSINSSNTLSVNYNGQRWRAPHGIQTPAVITVAESANGTDIVTTDFAVINWNNILSARWLNELRVQVGRDYEQQTPNASGGPGTSVTGGIGFGMPNFLPRPKYPFERRYQVINSLSHFRGPHTLKTGFDLNYVQEELQNLFQGGGVYSYTGLTTISQDCPPNTSGCVPVVDANTGRHYSNYNQAFDLNGLGGLLSFSSPTYAFYVQDTWRVSNRVMLNLGLRYEYQQLPQPGEIEVDGVTFRGNPNYPLTQSFTQDKNNWAPRIGLTWDFGANHTTVVRAAYGIFYGLTSNSAVANAITNNGVNQASYFFTPSTAGAPIYPNVLSAPPSIAGSRPDLQYFAADLERPEVHSLDISAERALPFGITGSATYMFSAGEKLPFFRDVNFNPPNSTVRYILEGREVGSFPLYRGSRPDPNFTRMIVMEADVSTRYHAMVLAARKRFSQGLMFDTSYTLARAKDNGQTSATFFGGNQPYDTLTARSNPIDNEMAPSNNDRRHRYVASFHYQPEYLSGIGVGAIVTLESGLPITQNINGTPPTGTAVNTSSTNGTGGSAVAPWVGFNTDRQPGRKTVDTRFSKRFAAGGRRSVEVLWEIFNVFDIENYSQFFNTAYMIPTGGATFDAAANLMTVNLVRDTGYLVARSASTNFWGPRDMQFGLKFLW